MSFLRKLLGTSTAAEERETAESLLAEGDPGSAKLRFEKALSKSSDANEKLELEARVQTCCDEIARRRMREAVDLLAGGERDLAEEEIHGALEVAHDDELRAELIALLDSADRARTLEPIQSESETAPGDAPTSAYEAMRSAEPTEADQSAEYDGYGPEFDNALLATFRGSVDEGITTLRSLLEDAQAPRYLHYELGMAYRLAEDLGASRDAFETFLTRIAPDEGGIARVRAHQALAEFLLAASEPESAIEEMQKAVEALPQSPTAFYELGSMLHRCGYPSEAADVFEVGVDLDGGDHWIMRQALGLAYRDAEKTEKAKQELEWVVEAFVQREDLRLPIESTEALAELYEQDATFTKAADLYRMLCESHSGPVSAKFHLKAGLLLHQAGQGDAGDQMLKRARTLAEQYEIADVAENASEQLAALADR